MAGSRSTFRSGDQPREWLETLSLGPDLGVARRRGQACETLGSHPVTVWGLPPQTSFGSPADSLWSAVTLRTRLPTGMPFSGGASSWLLNLCSAARSQTLGSPPSGRLACMARATLVTQPEPTSTGYQTCASAKRRGQRTPLVALGDQAFRLVLGRTSLRRQRRMPPGLYRAVVPTPARRGSRGELIGFVVDSTRLTAHSTQRA